MTYADKINKQVQIHANFVEEKRKEGGHRIFTALCGSQNYGLEEGHSDVDTKSIIIPDFQSLIFDKERKSETLFLPSGEQAEVKDVRVMIDTFFKQGINFLEILYTPYIDIALGYTNFYAELWTLRDKISRYDPITAVKAMAGCITHKCYQAFDGLKDTYDAKKLATAYRVADQLEAYSHGANFYEVLHSTDRNDYLTIKHHELDIETAVKLKEILIKDAQEITYGFIHDFRGEKDIQLAQDLKELIYELFQKEYF